MLNTSQEKNKKQKRLLWVIGAITVVLITLFFVNQNSGGNNAVQINPTGGTPSVFIDRERVNALQSTSSPTTYNLSDGTHQILIAQDGYWPWSDSVSVSGGETVEVSPFLIEESGRQVIQAASDVTNGLSTAQQQSVPTPDSPITSDDGNIRVFVDNNTNIIAQWTAGTSSAPDYFNCYEGVCGVSVYDNQPIRQVEFYPDRNDVIFFATDSGVYAIEIDPSGETQNFQPVAQSISNPVFTIRNDNIFVSSNGRITVSDI